jgi:flagella basal body P-ring formation protein FlgA
MKLRAIISIYFLLLVAALPATAQELASAAPAPAAAATLTRDELLTTLSRLLTERFQLRGELQLELQRDWAAPTAVPGGFEVIVLEYPARLASTLLLRVKLQTATRSFGEQVLPLHAQLHRDVYVVRTPLVREATFDVSQLDVRRVDVLREREVVAVDDIAGDYTYTTSTSAGRLLTWRDLARRPLVRKGQIIDVAAVDGAMTVTMKAQAMESGAAGESIRIRNLTSQKDFTACVVAEARAQVRF